LNHQASGARQLSFDRPLSRLLREAADRLEAQHIDEARLDAELLLAAVYGQTRAWLLSLRDEPVVEAVAQRFAAFIERRARHEPVAYILGHKEFYGLDLLVDRRVLIPRPETETLVDEALAWIRQHIDLHSEPSPFRGEGRELSVVDVGTGSGALAIALAAHTPAEAVRILAADVSTDALAVARANAERYGQAERIRFVLSDLLAGIDTCANLIVANLPYVTRPEWGDLTLDIRMYEPHIALDGGADGLDLIRCLIAQAPAHLAPGGALLLEIGWQQAGAVSALAEYMLPRSLITIVLDLAGRERVVRIESRDSDGS
jgi:release factor glutamine methyltransferase